MTPAGPQLDAIVRVSLPLLTVSVGAVLVDGFWHALPNPTGRRWATTRAARVPWHVETGGELTWWPVLPGREN